MINLTEMEKKVIISVYNDHYGDQGDCIWAWAHNDSFKPHNLPATSVPGVISSLVKKGLMTTGDVGRDATIGLTKEGQEIAATLG